VATKLDATTDRTRLEKLREFCAAQGLEFHAVSSASGEGIVELVRSMADALEQIPAAQPAESDAEEIAEDASSAAAEPTDLNAEGAPPVRPPRESASRRMRKR